MCGLAGFFFSDLADPRGTLQRAANAIAHRGPDDHGYWEDRDAGLFFKSIHGTLNHLLVAEHALWRRRFAEGVSPRLALDAELESDRARLRDALLEGAACWQPLIESWPEDRFEGALEYTSTQGVAMRLPFAAALAHVFNHGTHHRGQITAAITALGRPCPELDLVWMLQAERRT